MTFPYKRKLKFVQYLCTVRKPTENSSGLSGRRPDFNSKANIEIRTLIMVKSQVNIKVSVIMFLVCNTIFFSCMI